MANSTKKSVLQCPVCKDAIDMPKIIREEHGKTVVIRKTFCSHCGAFVEKSKFVNGREVGMTKDERSDTYTPVFGQQ